MAKLTPEEEAAAEARTAGLVDEGRLGTWMDERGLPGKGEPVSVSFISGGASNEIFRITQGRLRVGAASPTAHRAQGPQRDHAA